eukprot:4716688-Pleurochrysis_carterae.AAC.1
MDNCHGARRRAGASLSRWRAQPCNGSDSRPRLYCHPEHMLSVRIKYSNVGLRARAACEEFYCVLCFSIRRRLQRGPKINFQRARAHRI